MTERNATPSDRPEAVTIWRSVVAIGWLTVLTALVGLVYATQPQSPLDFSDRVTLLVDRGAYGPNLRAAERALERARRARAAGDERVAEELQWEAAGGFARAAASAHEPRGASAANDRGAEVYLRLGRLHLERGRGRVLGLGRRPEALASAERAAVCAAALNPTSRREEINAFLQAVEDALGRPPAGKCSG